jgi:hypothetical protein
MILEMMVFIFKDSKLTSSKKTSENIKMLQRNIPRIKRNQRIIQRKRNT